MPQADADGRMPHRLQAEATITPVNPCGPGWLPGAAKTDLRSCLASISELRELHLYGVSCPQSLACPQLRKLTVSEGSGDLSLGCPQLRTLRLEEYSGEAKVELACPLLEGMWGIEHPNRQLRCRRSHVFARWAGHRLALGNLFMGDLIIQLQQQSVMAFRMECAPPASMGHGKGTKKKIAPEVASMLGRATMHYIAKEFKEAIEILQEVIKKAPSIVDPYHTLGLIYEELGESTKAIEFYLIAAHIAPSDVTQWERIAQMSLEQNNTHQAVYCYQKILKVKPNDRDAALAKARALERLGDHPRALETLITLHQAKPEDEAVVQELAKTHHALGQDAEAAQVGPRAVAGWVLEGFLGESTDNLNLVNMLCESDIALRRWAHVTRIACPHLTLLRTTHLPSGRLAGLPGGRAALDLLAKLAVAQIWLQNTQQVDVLVNAITSEPADMYGDLFIDVGDAFLATESWERALALFSMAQAVPALDQPALWVKMGKCYKALGQRAEAIQCYERFLLEKPDALDERLEVAQLHQAAGNLDRALAFLESHAATRERREGATAMAALQRARSEVDGQVASLLTAVVDKAEAPALTEEPRLALMRASVLYDRHECEPYLRAILPVLGVLLWDDSPAMRAPKGPPKKRPAQVRTSDGHPPPLTGLEGAGCPANPSMVAPRTGTPPIATPRPSAPILPVGPQEAASPAEDAPKGDAVPGSEPPPQPGSAAPETPAGGEEESGPAPMALEAAEGDKDEKDGKDRLRDDEQQDPEASQSQAQTQTPSSQSQSQSQTPQGKQRRKRPTRPLWLSTSPSSPRVCPAGHGIRMPSSLRGWGLGDLVAGGWEVHSITETILLKQRALPSATDKPDATAVGPASGSPAEGQPAEGPRRYHREDVTTVLSDAEAVRILTQARPPCTLPAPPCPIPRPPLPSLPPALPPHTIPCPPSPRPIPRTILPPILASRSPTVHMLMELRLYRESSRLVQLCLRFIPWPKPLEASLRLLTVDPHPVARLPAACPPAVAFNSANYVAALDVVRPLCLEKPYSFAVWSLYNRVDVNGLARSDFSSVAERKTADLQVTGSIPVGRLPFADSLGVGVFFGLDLQTGSTTRNYKFLMRLLAAYPHSAPIMILAGNSAFLSGQMAAAQAEYTQALRYYPNDPFLYFLLGLSILHRVMLKRTSGTERHALVLMAFAFFQQYAQRRHKPDEVFYNLGRALHQLGLFHLALPLYERSLRAAAQAPSVLRAAPGGPEAAAPPSMRLEAQYNLALIHREGGERAMARHILWNNILV
ncbi:putative transcription factor IIIC-gamma subunit [Paratrimastix pyriformis]|uniref:Transcription factor IIIC-gamma subunit n=1 Tax=Paratrimastix pyriformis TaxID=342808 RepID=A0ABQ8ULD2_9EUKA|nr:putative transcription factor IIIC-gamma subunit [Paratrimastix pyriformis]